MQSRIDKVKRCFQQMDLEGLKKILNSRDELLQTSTRHFYRIIGQLFNQFKDKGETFLYIFEGIGENEYRSERPAYRFIGNNFKNYFEFIIEEGHEDTLKIAVCENVAIHLGEHFPIVVDEYIKSPDYQSDELIQEFRKGSKAFEELEALKKNVNDLSVYIGWIENYTPLFEKHIAYDDISNTGYIQFFTAFLKLRKLKNFKLDLFTFAARQGYKEYQSIATEKPLEILIWLCRYERVRIWFISYFDESVESNIEKGVFDFDGYKIRLGALDEVLKFIHYYNFHDRFYSHEIFNLSLEYDEEFTDYYSPNSKGFYERNLQKLGVYTEVIKIHGEEDPIESYFISRALNQ